MAPALSTRRAAASPGRGRPVRSRRFTGFATLLLLQVALLAGCGGRAPSADRPPPRAPDVSGRAVMLLPVQGGLPDAAAVEAELAYWLLELGAATRWVLPATLEQMVARSPALHVPLGNLAIQSFHRAQVRNIGDPLFGDLRRLGAFADARYALVPVRGGYIPGEAGREGRVEIAAALIDTVGGAVLWFGVVAGQNGPPGSPATTASAARALARTLFP